MISLQESLHPKGTTLRRGLFCFVALVCSLALIVGCCVVSADPVLEISVSLIEEEFFSPGDTIHSIVEIRNRDASGRIDVVVEYGILDESGSVVLSDTKTVAIETKSSFAESFNLPSYISEGSYSLYATVTSLDGSVSNSASSSFDVLEVSASAQYLVEFVMGTALVSTFAALFYEHRRISKLKVSEVDFKDFVKRRGE